MKLKKVAWQLHKYLSYFIFAQIFLWILGGVVFATVPFKSMVKGADYAGPPAAITLPSEWPQWVSKVAEEVQSVNAVASAQGPLIKITLADGELWLNQHGKKVGVADALAIAAYAGEIHTAAGELHDVRWIAESEPQMLGLVDELSGRTGVWQAKFDDARIYFSAQGEYLKVRTDYWVWYDAFWRLHIMDYGQGEDFNNGLLRFFAWFTFAFVLSGLVLSFYAFRRTLARLT